jgi:hypothetical protein
LSNVEVVNMYMNNIFSPITAPMSNQSCFSKAHRAANGYPFTPSGLPSPNGRQR